MHTEDKNIAKFWSQGQCASTPRSHAVHFSMTPSLLSQRAITPPSLGLDSNMPAVTQPARLQRVQWKYNVNNLCTTHDIGTESAEYIHNVHLRSFSSRWAKTISVSRRLCCCMGLLFSFSEWLPPQMSQPVQLQQNNWFCGDLQSLRSGETILKENKKYTALTHQAVRMGWRQLIQNQGAHTHTADPIIMRGMIVQQSRFSHGRVERWVSRLLQIINPFLRHQPSPSPHRWVPLSRRQ